MYMTYRGIINFEDATEKIVASKLDGLLRHNADDVCRQSSMCTRTNTHSNTHSNIHTHTLTHTHTHIHTHTTQKHTQKHTRVMLASLLRHDSNDICLQSDMCSYTNTNTFTHTHAHAHAHTHTHSLTHKHTFC